LYLKAAIHNEIREAMEHAVLTIRIPADAMPELHAATISALASNLDRLRVEAGWSFDDMYAATGISKKLSLGHIRHNKGITPRNLKVYADAFAKALKRPVTVAQLSVAVAATH
jgi:hypothetical protein